MKQKEFDNAADAYNYLYGVDDGQVNVGDYDKIVVSFVKVKKGKNEK